MKAKIYLNVDSPEDKSFFSHHPKKYARISFEIAHYTLSDLRILAVCTQKYQDKRDSQDNNNPINNSKEPKITVSHAAKLFYWVEMETMTDTQNSINKK